MRSCWVGVLDGILGGDVRWDGRLCWEMDGGGFWYLGMVGFLVGMGREGRVVGGEGWGFFGCWGIRSQMLD